jgi:hypothetical protein
MEGWTQQRMECDGEMVSVTKKDAWATLPLLERLIGEVEDNKL